MAFSGLAVLTVPSFLANTGLDPTAIVNLLPNNYPIAEARTFTALSANIDTPIPALASITVTVRKAGADTALAVTFPAGHPAGVPVTFAVPVLFAVNDVFDLRVTSTGVISVPTGISATVATAP